LPHAAEAAPAGGTIYLKLLDDEVLPILDVPTILDDGCQIPGAVL
jgi:hypothetical protein